MRNFESDAPGRTRTCGPLIRSQMLYPTELRVRELIACRSDWHGVCLLVRVRRACGVCAGLKLRADEVDEPVDLFRRESALELGHPVAAFVDLLDVVRVRVLERVAAFEAGHAQLLAVDVCDAALASLLVAFGAGVVVGRACGGERVVRGGRVRVGGGVCGRGVRRRIGVRRMCAVRRSAGVRVRRAGEGYERTGECNQAELESRHGKVSVNLLSIVVKSMRV